jgi:glycine/D-amino acid oxidase-like deaminating enzyme
MKSPVHAHPPLAARNGSGPLDAAGDVPLWLDDAGRPDPRPALDADLTVDLAVVGGGLSGVWTALQAIEAAGGARSVALLEAGTLAWAASGRNGGFCSSSLTHGLANGLARWPKEMPQLLRMGAANLDEIEQTIARLGIDCDFTRRGEVTVAVAGWQVEELREVHRAALELGEKSEFLDTEQVRAVAGSPTYLAGTRDPDGTAVLNPARLVWGLAAAAERLGVAVHEHTRVTGVRDEGDRVRLSVAGPRGARHTVRARRVVLATSAFPSPLRRLRPFTVPVWDHVLATEPLTDQQWQALGWQGGEGISDAGNQFHYYRTTADRRVVWGGYDALYYYGSDLRQFRARRPSTENTLAEHFFATFPQLDGVRFSHLWAGAIDTSTRFTPFWARGLSGKLVSVQGFTGLGVGSSRFAAGVALDLADGHDTERTRLSMVTRAPVPFPPEPFRWAGITMTRRSISRADATEGRRDLWLRTLDRLGLGFDS